MTLPRPLLSAVLFGSVCASTLASTQTASAADYYVDPATGSMQNDGSAAKPWSTLEDVIAANLIETRNWASLPYAAGAQLVAKNAGAKVKAGDTIWLRDGYHGKVEILGYYNTSPITIAAVEGHTPKLASLRIRSGQHWKVSGLHFSPDFAPSYEKQTLIDLDSHGYSGPVSDIVIEHSRGYSVSDSGSWTEADWNDLAVNAIGADGENITLRHNQFRNVNFGISVSASNSLVEHNVVDSFSGDGLRGLGDDTTFQYNVVKNAYKVNSNHDDGFQSWSVGPDGVGTGEVKGIVLRGNVFINYEDPNQKFRGTLQGIGCFDGMFVDWVIENNVVITDHWHGITLLGAKNARIINNTVIDLNDEKPGPPWIQIGAHKDGTPPTGGIVRNNLVTALNLASSGVTEDHNIILDDPSAFFVDAANFDLRLLPGSSAVDTGSTELAPPTDIDGIPRPQGSGVDVGAYEWHDGTVEPDGGIGSGGTSGNGGTSGSGGSSAGGGSAASGGGDGGPGGSSSADSASDDGGCGCRTTGTSSNSGAALLLGLIALLGVGRRSGNWRDQWWRQRW